MCDPPHPLGCPPPTAVINVTWIRKKYQVELRVSFLFATGTVHSCKLNCAVCIDTAVLLAQWTLRIQQYTSNCDFCDFYELQMFGFICNQQRSTSAYKNYGTSELLDRKSHHRRHYWQWHCNLFATFYGFWTISYFLVHPVDNGLKQPRKF